MAKNRIDYINKGVDDVAIDGVTLFRMEWMDNSNVWIRLYRKDGKDVVFRLGAGKCHIKGKHEFDFENKMDTPDIEVNE
jgi:hypothetical protein